MRRSLGTLSHTTNTIGNASAKHHFFLPSSSSAVFSTSSGGGGGGGRGRGGSDFPNSSRFGPDTLGKSQPSDDQNHPKDESPSPSGLGHGQGRGKPLPSNPILPSFSSFMSSNTAARGRGRGSVSAQQSQQPSRSQQQQPTPRKPIFFVKDDAPSSHSDSTPSETPDRTKTPQESNLPSSILSVLPGAGRGKPLVQPLLANVDQEGTAKQVENRHMRVRKPGQVPGREKDRESSTGTTTSAPKLSQEDARKKAMEVLMKGERNDDGDIEDGSGRGRGRGFGRGRGRGRRSVPGRFGPRRRRIDDEDYGTGLYLGDDADGEKLAKRLGPEKMNKLVEVFDEISSSVLPSPMEDAYLDALDTNLKIECEPEYLMGEFDTNPDIDEKPPIPLREALEKMKPFLMAYEGIQSHEEWEEVVKETMERVPLLKEIVDHYSGPDRVTAKRQNEELERVGKTLPESAPASVKRFTERAVLSLQSNPGWGFDKKCQFMDKLVWEVSQQYK